MSGDFRLSAVLRGHEEDVRALAYPDSKNILSTSRDSTVRRWTLQSAQPPAFDETTVLTASDWLNCLAYTGPSDVHAEGLIAAAGKDTVIFVQKLGASLDADPYRILPQHAHTVSSLAFNRDGTRLVSGGWDSQVFLWDVEAGEVIAELQGHHATVWGVLFLDDKLILTACADKLIRVFDLRGKLQATIEGHTDVVRCFCAIPKGHWSGAAFASAGNDEVVRLWSSDGTPMGELHAHEAYIYSIDILPNGDIVTAGEDRTLRVFRDMQCIQTITHPAVSIWSVAACPQTGDIVTGASDKIIRVFTRDADRYAASDVLAAFEESNKMYAIPAETASQGLPFQKEDLPTTEALRTQTGTRDGQQLFVRENDGSVTAHLWSSSRGQWDLIGTVVSGEGSGSSKKTHNGKEYDYVFDIDIEEGKPPLKLAYNLTESPWEAARKFLESNELPMSYYEQVANWITDNTKGANLAQASSSTTSRQTQAPPSDPWGTDRRYRPGDAPSSYSASKLPQTSYMTIVEGNPANAIKLITDKAQASGELTSSDIAALKTLASQLQNKNDPKPTSEQISALLKIATTAPVKARVPAVGILAVCAVSPSFIQHTSSGEKTFVDTIASANLLSPKQETANNVVHSIRTLVNLFATETGRLIADGSQEQILQLVRPFAAEPESPAQAKALATLYLNYAVLLTSKAPAQASSARREARAEVILTDIAFVLESDSPHAAEPDALYRALASLGTLLSLGGEFRQKMKMGISGTLHVAGAKANAQLPNTKDLLAEIRDALR